MDRLEENLVLEVLRWLDTGENVARAACVCSSWHKLVVEGRFWRNLCTARFPELGIFLEAHDNQTHKPRLESEHIVFKDLYQSLTRNMELNTCIRDALEASSTDNPPQEHIIHTLHPRPKKSGTSSYWSSRGQELEDVPETLTYRLASPLCLVDEIKIRPFKAYFQPGNPIYSSKFVRFKFGYEKEAKDYEWTYVSPMYPMEQADTLQTFQLPEPIVCIGGIFQVELIGRVERQATDLLYYVCICHVCVRGKPLYRYTMEKEGERFLLVRLAEGDDNIPTPVDEEMEDIHDRRNNLLMAFRARGDFLVGHFLDGQLMDEEEEDDEDVDYDNDGYGLIYE